MKGNLLLANLRCSTLLVGLAVACLSPLAALVAHAQGHSPGGGFVPDARCADCHRSAAKKWGTSHHAAAMSAASEKTVLGDFNDATFEDAGIKARFVRQGDAYVIRTKGRDGQVADYEVRYTFGVSPLQQYLVAIPGGRLQAFTVAWDVAKRRWYSLYPGQRFEPDDGLHWSGRYQNWNGMCAECHSTNLRKGYDPEKDTYSTTWSEVNVGCQACHGPGAEHLAWAKAPGASSAPENRGLLIDFENGSSRYQVDQCARCHSRRQRVAAEDEHGRAFLDDFVPQTLRADLYHPDGQIDGEVYVYGSFVQSKMYAAGVRCTDCHDAHSGALKKEGDTLCTRCHSEQPNTAFAGLRAKRYDSPEHHFHPAGSSGSACVACHMPGKTYMGIDYRRDHSIRIPRPGVSRKLATPNACNECHQDRDAGWAAAQIAQRTGKAATAHPFGAALAAGRAGRPDAAPPLTALAQDPSQPEIARATALEQLGNYGAPGGRAVARGLDDPSALVRVAALRALERYPPRAKVAGALPRLADPVRAVRIEAARILSAIPSGELEPAIRARYDASLAEYKAALQARSDQPSGRLNLAVLAERQGNPIQAEKFYRTALEMDAYFVPARFNLANLLSRQGRHSDAESVLRGGIERALADTPEKGELHYSLGLLLAEAKRMDEAADALAAAARNLPARARVHYNWGLVLQRIGRDFESERVLRRAAQLDPNDIDVVQTLTIFYAGRQQWARAEEQARTLVRLRPQSRRAQATLAQIQAARKQAGPQ